MAGFMAGFGATLSNSIEADREYYREAASKRRDYLQTYGTKAVLDREDKANAAMGVVNTLKTRGFDNDTLRYTVDTAGVQGLLALDDATKNRDDLSKEDISGIVEMSKDYVKENPDMDLQQVIARAYGLYKSTDNPVKRERNIFASVLGLDSGLAEDEVLDDIYVNGFTGRDIYRIMGSSGPKAKGALELNIPKKPLANATLVSTYNFVQDKFKDSVNAELDAIKARGAVNGTGDSGFNLQDNERKKYLETLLGMGTEGMVLWMNTTPTFRADVSAFEEATPGSITNNPYLRDLGLAYEAGPPEEETPRGKGNTTISTSVETPRGPVTQYKTRAALDAAIANGKHKQGDRVQVENGNVQILQQPSDTVLEGVGISPITATGSKPEATKELSTEANFDRDGDLSGYTDLYESIMARPEDERSDFLKTATNLSKQKNLADITVELAEATPALTDRAVGATAGGVVLAANLLNKALAYAYNRLTGDSNTAAGVITTSNLNIEVGKELIAEGIVATLQEQATLMELNGPFNQGRADKIKKALEDKRAIREELTESDVLNKAAEDMLLRIRDNDRQFLADDRNFPNAPTFVKQPVKEPKGLMSSRRPKVKPLRLGQPEFMDLIKTLHGSGSSVTATWEEKTSSPNAKLKVSDVTRLIKETKALPETKSRGKLLESLYDLRDVLNKRK